MKCPVCPIDLSPLDIVSRNEHITLCLENGPSVVEYEAGQLVIKKNVPLDKQRKICPVCSKTFQNIFTHFKSCALKNDLTPDLMQTHWFQLNDDCKTSKVFPRDLLESYIAKSTREGRVGEQVEFARELLQTLPETTRGRQRISRVATSSYRQMHADESNQSIVNSTNNDSNSVPLGSVADSGGQSEQQQVNAQQILMQNATRAPAGTSTSSGRQTSKAKTQLELASKADRKHNIELRIERELAAPRLERYRRAMREAAAESGTQVVDECIVLVQEQEGDMPLQTRLARAASVAAAQSGQDETVNLSKYFYRARLKDCTHRDACLRAECQDHDVHLGIEEFWIYYGKSLLEPTRHEPPSPVKEDQWTHNDDKILEPKAATTPKENLPPDLLKEPECMDITQEPVNLDPHDELISRQQDKQEPDELDKKHETVATGSPTHTKSSTQ